MRRFYPEPLCREISPRRLARFMGPSTPTRLHAPARAAATSFHPHRWPSGWVFWKPSRLTVGVHEYNHARDVETDHTRDYFDQSNKDFRSSFFGCRLRCAFNIRKSIRSSNRRLRRNWHTAPLKRETGVQSAAVAAEVYANATARGLGKKLPLDWFLRDVTN